MLYSHSKLTGASLFYSKLIHKSNRTYHTHITAVDISSVNEVLTFVAELHKDEQVNTEKYMLWNFGHLEINNRIIKSKVASYALGEVLLEF